MIKVKQAIVVEGKYDKIKLDSIVDGTIIVTGGFEIFKDREKQALLRLLGQKVGLVVLTDSDVAGFRIRRFLGNIVGKDRIINAYIPDILGKERRKAKASAEGKLGVEGVPKEVLLKALADAGVLAEDTGAQPPRQPITKLDLMEDGLSGGKNSTQKRAALLKKANLPEHLTTNAMIEVLNTLMTREEYQALAAQIHAEFLAAPEE